MRKIIYQGKTYSCKENETVLEALLRANINVSFSCRNGICHSCLLRAKNGTPSKRSQKGLNDSLTTKGFFLACRCQLENDLEIELPKVSDLYGRAVICHKEMMTGDICRVYLEPSTALYYHPGQFINIRRGDGLMRSYSLASDPSEEQILELHVKRLPDGAMSRWLIEDAEVGSEVDFQGPLGDCYYRNGSGNENMLLICTGTGLAPMLGIVKDALNHRHTGQIDLFHGSSQKQGLYLTDYFHNLQKLHSNFGYYPCVSAAADPVAATGRASDIALDGHQDLSNWRVYIAGNPAMVYEAKKRALGQGASLEHLYTDPFEFSQSLVGDGATEPQQDTGTSKRDAEVADQNPLTMIDPPYPKPDLDMWRALEEGKLLTAILTEFYDRVFEDEKLNGFFKDTTKNRAIEKQYNFLCKVFTGEKVYFGEKPRNAHSWMVISSELYDYREAIMKSCLQKHGLPEHLIDRWMAMEYNYKSVIVKNKPWSKVVDGVEYPVDGFGEIVTEIGTLCDGCTNEIAAGETVSYHLRIGTVYCKDCRKNQESVADL